VKYPICVNQLTQRCRKTWLVSLLCTVFRFVVARQFAQGRGILDKNAATFEAYQPFVAPFPEVLVYDLAGNAEEMA
jgi:hypothetical protein